MDHIQSQEISSTVENPSTMDPSDVQNNSTACNVECIQSNELYSNLTVQGNDPNNSMAPQSSSQCDASPEVSSTSSLLEFARENLTFMQHSMESRDAMLQAYRQSRGSPFGEIMHFPRIPPTVQRLGGWINDCPLQIIEDEVVPLGVVPRGRFSETSSDDDEHSQATTHVSPSDNESEDDEIEKWFKPIPLPPDFEGQM